MTTVDPTATPDPAATPPPAAPTLSPMNTASGLTFATLSMSDAVLSASLPVADTATADPAPVPVAAPTADPVPDPTVTALSDSAPPASVPTADATASADTTDPTVGAGDQVSTASSVPTTPATPTAPATVQTIPPVIPQGFFHDSREVDAADQLGLPTSQGAPLNQAALDKIVALDNVVIGIRGWCDYLEREINKAKRLAQA